MLKSVQLALDPISNSEHKKKPYDTLIHAVQMISHNRNHHFGCYRSWTFFVGQATIGKQLKHIYELFTCKHMGNMIFADYIGIYYLRTATFNNWLILFYATVCMGEHPNQYSSQSKIARGVKRKDACFVFGYHNIGIWFVGEIQLTFVPFKLNVVFFLFGMLVYLCEWMFSQWCSFDKLCISSDIWSNIGWFPIYLCALFNVLSNNNGSEFHNRQLLCMCSMMMKKK